MLPERLHGYLTYFEHLATQPANRWHGFYTPQREDSHFGLRYQLAFPCYALASIGLHPQAASSEQHRCRSAMAALIDRMIQRRVWAYWASDAEQAGLNPDPVLDGNGQYSGHLAMMMGVYEAVGGDRRYDEAFTFRWSPLERFTYTHSSLVQALWQQMQSNSHHGVEAQARQVRVSDMMHTLWAMLLHDRVHGTSYAATNAAWLAFMRQQLILRELPLLGRRGIFNPCYTTRPHLFTPAALSVVDAWTLALLAPLDAALTATLAPRLLRRVRQRSTADSPTMQAYLPAARGWRASEVADQTTCTGFAYLCTVECGDERLATGLRAYADAHFQPMEHDGERSYREGLAPALTTALFALGEAGGLRSLLTAREPAEVVSEPGPEAPVEAQV